jgi:4-azaleucine resistance transporter AzlC
MTISSPSNKSEFWNGYKGTLPLLTSVLPFGVLYGALAPAAGLPPVLAQAMSAIVFAGSAQFLAAQLFHGAASALVILLTTLVINLRHVLYGISVVQYAEHLPARWKWLMAYVMTDEAYAVAISRYRRETPGQAAPGSHWFYLGSGIALWSGWQISTAVGVLFGQQIPSSWGLEFAAPLTFIALVVPAVIDRAGVTAALTAGAAAVLMVALPLKLGVILAGMVGILAGMLVRRGSARLLTSLIATPPAGGREVPGECEDPAAGGAA